MRSTLLPRLPLLLAAAFLAGGCDSPTAPDLRQPHTVQVTSGDGQAGTVAQPLAEPLVVWVGDRHRRPVAGRMVTFTPIGGGTVAPGTTATDAHGYALARWTLGTRTAEDQQVRVTLAGPARGAVPAATFGARPRADLPEWIEPDSLCECAGITLSGTTGLPLPDSLPVRVMDRFGNPVAGAAVVWRVVSGGGGISPETGTTGSDGVARAMWTLGPHLDGQMVEAAAGLTLRTEFYADARLGIGARLVKLSGDGQTGGAGETLAEPLRVSLHLPDGRPVVGAPISWTAAGGATFSPSVTDENGEAATEWTLGAPLGAIAATAVVEGGEPVVFTATSVLLPKKVSPLYPMPGNPGLARPVVGAASSVADDSLGVIVSDRYDRPVPGVEVSWRVTRGSVSPAVSVTDAAGVSRAQWTLGAQGGAEAVTSIAGSDVMGTTGYAVGGLYKGPEDALFAVAGNAVMASVETAEYVEGAVVHWTVLSGGGSVASPTSRTVLNYPRQKGAASIRWTLGSAGPQTLRATLGPFQVTLTATAGPRGSRVLLTQVPGTIMDATRDRVLWFDGSGTRRVKLRDVASGTDVTLIPGAAADPERGHLFSAGALISVPSGEGTSVLYEWKNGTLSSLGPIGRGSLRVNGEWAGWWLANSCYRRDLAAGTTLAIPGLRGMDAVGPNGDVVWGGLMYRDGRFTQRWTLTGAFATDGVNIVGYLYALAVTYDFLILTNNLINLNTVHVKTTGLRPYGQMFQLNGGWTGYTKVVYPSSATYYAYYRAERLPQPLRAGTPPSMVEAISPTGDLVYRTPGDRWLDVPGGPLYFFGPAADGERVVWRSGTFLLITPDGTLYGLIP